MPGGRPPNLNEQIIEGIVNRVLIGMHEEHAARACGIAPSTYYDWKKRGHDLVKINVLTQEWDHLYISLVQQIETAKGRAIEMLTTDLRKQAIRDPRAAVEMLKYLDARWRYDQKAEERERGAELTITVETVPLDHSDRAVGTTTGDDAGLVGERLRGAAEQRGA